MKQQSGFTLIELIMVIVILGILAATALPKFVDLRTDAAKAATDGMAGALNSAFAINYGARMVNSSKGVAVAGSMIACNDATVMGTAGVLQGGLPDGFTMSGSVTCGDTAGVQGACTVTGQQSQTATVTLICTGV